MLRRAVWRQTTLQAAEELELRLSQRELVPLLNKLLRKQRSQAQVLDVAVTLKETFSRLGAAIDVSTYNILLQIALKHDLQRCIPMASCMSEEPGCFANGDT